MASEIVQFLPPPGYRNDIRKLYKARQCTSAESTVESGPSFRRPSLVHGDGTPAGSRVPQQLQRGECSSQDLEFPIYHLVPPSRARIITPLEALQRAQRASRSSQTQLLPLSIPSRQGRACVSAVSDALPQPQKIEDLRECEENPRASLPHENQSRSHDDALTRFPMAKAMQQMLHARATEARESVDVYLGNTEQSVATEDDLAEIPVLEPEEVAVPEPSIPKLAIDEAVAKEPAIENPVIEDDVIWQPTVQHGPVTADLCLSHHHAQPSIHSLPQVTISTVTEDEVVNVLPSSASVRSMQVGHSQDLRVTNRDSLISLSTARSTNYEFSMRHSAIQETVQHMLEDAQQTAIVRPQHVSNTAIEVVTGTYLIDKIYVNWTKPMLDDLEARLANTRDDLKKWMGGKMKSVEVETKVVKTLFSRETRKAIREAIAKDKKGSFKRINVGSKDDEGDPSSA